MRNFLKLKIGISLFSVTILVIIPLLKSNFNAPITIKRWGKLSWNDFKGLAPPFSGYAAAISSDLYLEYDSATARFHAYAGQHNIHSWKQAKLSSPDYSLNHEQYHFNITELHARILNEYIQANPNETEYFYRLRLQSAQMDLHVMQTAYDEQTDHALIESRQGRWEYTIDSLLLVHSSDSGWVTDYFSGATIYFPSTPHFRSGYNEYSMFRRFQLSKYGMTLSLFSFQYETMDIAVFENNLRQFYTDAGAKIDKFATDYSEYLFKATVVGTDTLNNTFHNIWVYDDAYLFQVKAEYYDNGKDSTVYLEIINSFLNSFKIENTDGHWISHLKTSKVLVTHSKVTKVESDTSLSNCMVLTEVKPYGFFRGPIYAENGGLLLAYDPTVHTDSLISGNTLLLNQNVYSSKSTSEDYLFFVPKEHQPNKIYGINFGYLLKQDSTTGCKSFYSQWLEINPEKGKTNAILSREK